MINILLFIAFIIIVNIIIGKFNLLPNYSGNDHQIFFANEGNIQLSGGIFILILFIILFFHEFILICFFTSIFFNWFS